MRIALTFLVASLAVSGCSFISVPPGAFDADRPDAFATTQPDLDRFAETIAGLMLPADPERGPGDWRTVETARWVRWQAPSVAVLSGEPRDPGDFTRKGTANFGGNRFEVVADGSRDALLNVQFRNEGPPIGEARVVAGLQAADFIVALARCSLPASPVASDNWWRIVSPGKRPAFFHVEQVCEGNSCERFDLMLADTLPPLTASQRLRYTDHCTDDASGGPIAEDKDEADEAARG